MTSAAALLAQQPVAFWLAVAGVLLAAAIAAGRRVAVAAALAASLGAVAATVDPAAPWAQAAAALVGMAAVLVARLILHRTRGGESDRGGASATAIGEARLLGRTARARGPFVEGAGEVEVDGAPRPARTRRPDEAVSGDALVRIVRVGEDALVVRVLHASAD